MPGVGAALVAFGEFLAGSAIATSIFQTVVGVGLSVLARAVQKKPSTGSARAGGIVQDVTQTGGVNPASFIIGRYASNGTLAAPPYSLDTGGGIPFGWLHYVIDLSDVPIQGVTRLFLDGEEVTFAAGGPGVGEPDGKWLTKVYMTVHDGSQTVADSGMLGDYATHPERPWSADMVGTGVAYCRLAFGYDRELFRGFPSVRFEVDGIGLYDPRLDSTVGGSGAHRHDDPTTWTWSENPAVAIYNLLRGIPLSDGSTYGGRFDADALPLSNWFAAMNDCDALVPISGGTEKSYRCGLEIRLDEEPAGPIGELLKACSGEISEHRGEVFMNVGAPALPVHSITDDDLIVESPDQLTPYPELSSTYNAVSASYPEPSALWEARNAPIRVDAQALSDDGRELIADVPLPAVPFPVQVQRLQQAWLLDERRFRQHQITLPMEYRDIRPLEVLAWTSARNGYTAKAFEVTGAALDPLTLTVAVGIREIDPDDYGWVAGDEIATTPPAPSPVVPPIYTVPGWVVQAYTIQDANPDDRRPAIKLSWLTGLAGVTGMRWQLRIAGTTQMVDYGSTEDIDDGEHILSGGSVLPNVGYEVRGRLVAHGLETAWTAWTAVTTPDVRVGTVDLFENAVSVVRRYTATLSGVGSTYLLRAEVTFSEAHSHETLIIARYNGWAQSLSGSNNDESDIFLHYAAYLSGVGITSYEMKQVLGIPGAGNAGQTELEKTPDFVAFYPFSIGPGDTRSYTIDMNWSSFDPGTSNPRNVYMEGLIDLVALTVKR